MQHNLLDEVSKEVETIKYPIGICFKKSDLDRWMKLKKDLLKHNKNARITEFARRTLLEMMTDLEVLLEKKKKSKT